MQLNCKIGDLAIVVATELPQNLGQIVEILGIQTGKPFLLRGSGHCWQVRAVSGRKTLTYRFNDTGEIITRVEGPAPDQCLRPVTGLKDEDALLRSLRTESGELAWDQPSFQT